MKRIKKWIATIIISVFLSSLLLPFGVLAEEFENKERLGTENADLQEETEKILIEENEVEIEAPKELKENPIVDNLPSLEEEVVIAENGDEIIEFKDENLLTALISESRQIDKNKDGMISKKELEVVERLDLNYCGISDTTGLEFATNLIDLSLKDNALSNVAPLKNLKKLETLELKGYWNTINDQDRMDLLYLDNMTIFEGSQKDILKPKGIFSSDEAETFEIKSANSKVFSVIRYDYWNSDGPKSDILLTGKNIGVGKASLSKGEAKREFDVTVEKMPSGNIKFEDELLLANLLLKCKSNENTMLDENSDGAISISEIEKQTDLYLDSQGIKSVKGLENATNLKEIILRNNPDFSDVSPLTGIVDNLTRLDLVGTQVPGKDRMDIIKIGDQRVNQHHEIKFVTIPEDVLEPEKIEMTFGESIAELKNGSEPRIKGLLPGKGIGTLSYEGITKDFNAEVNAVIVDQPLEDSLADEEIIEINRDGTRLNGDGDLLNLSKEPPVIEKEGLRDYQIWETCKSLPDNGRYGFRYGIGIDKENHLWMKEIDTQNNAFVKKLSNVKGTTVAEFAYGSDSDGESIIYDWNLALDNEENLWMFEAHKEKKEYEKVLSNVKKIENSAVLLKNNELWKIQPSVTKIMEDVIEISYQRTNVNLSSQIVFALKSDHTLWMKKGDEESVLLDTEIESIIEDDYKRESLFKKKDNTVWCYSSGDQNKYYKVGSDIKKKIGSYFVKNDGNTYGYDYLEGTATEKKVLDGEISGVKNFTINGEIYDFLYNSITNELWRRGLYGENREAVKVSSDFKKFFHVSYYIDINGEWRSSLTGEKTTVNDIVFNSGNYNLRGDKTLYAGKDTEAPVLSQVVNIEYVHIGMPPTYFATRSDGSIWEVSETSPPKKIQSYQTKQISLTGRLIAEDGKPLSKKTIEFHSDVQTTETDANGYFTFEKATMGAHTLYVKDKETGSTLYQMPLTINAGEKTEIKGNGEISVKKDVSAITLNLKVPKTGTEIKIEQVEEGDKTPERILGDVDANGEIQAYDALLTLQIATGKRGGTPEEILAANVDGEEGVQAYDALRILQFATGKISEFSVMKKDG